MQSIALGADHGGFELKQVLAAHLTARGFQVEDCGTHGKDPVDYPTIAVDVARRVADGRCQLGIMIDGAGIGSAMAANKIAGVRAALCYDISSARNSREHNNANLLTLGASLIGAGLAVQIVDTFVNSQCTVERHLRRVAMIDEIDRGAEQSDAGCGCGNKPCSCSDRPSNMAESTLTDLSETDLKRVAERIAQMLQGGAAPDAAALCNEAACGFCRSCAEINPQAVREMIGLGADRIVHRGDGQAVPADVASYIDHTLLRPDATFDQITKLCQEAAQFHFASVCVNPYYVKHCASLLRGSSAKVCTVVGFPLGANATETKALEARRAIRDGAREIDMVINVGAIKSGRDDEVYRDIRAVVEACIDGGAICKVILETALLTDDEKVRACRAARRAQADFVKTSTGFGPGGATAEDVALMSSEVAGTRMGVKASGGIRNYEQAQQMIRAGATRLGASAGVRIVKESQGVTISDAAAEKY